MLGTDQSGLMIKDLPVDWKAVIENLENEFPEAIIAGGAIRDLLLGRPVKDLDILISSQGREMSDIEETIYDSFWLQDYLFKPLVSDLRNYQLNFADVKGVWQSSRSTAALATPIQLILIEGDVTPETAAARCDFGLCRVSWKDGNYFLHQDFLSDVALEQMTLRKCSYPQSHYRRWQRLRQKYQVPLVAPEWGDFDEWFKKAVKALPEDVGESDILREDIPFITITNL